MENKTMDLIIFPLHNWRKCVEEGFRTRDAHLIREFEKDPRVGRVLIVERPVTLPEMVYKKKWWRLTKNVVYKKGRVSICRVSDKVHLLEFFSLEIFAPAFKRHEWWSSFFKKPWVHHAVNEAALFLELKNNTLFLWSPFVAGVLGNINSKAVVFDALDNWLKHPDVQGDLGHIEKGYEKIKQKTHLIFANSRKLQDFMEVGKNNVHFIPNGVDKESFASFQGDCPEDLKSIPHPIVGYAGKISHRIDIRLMEFLCNELPHVNFVFIGSERKRNFLETLVKKTNFFYLGDKHYSQLPAYLNVFDICIIPHDINQQNDGDAIKLYEYLSAGKPVVTTNIDGVDVFKSDILLAQDHDAFLDGVKEYLGEFDSGDIKSDKIKGLINQSHTWSFKAEKMLNLIEEKVF